MILRFARWATALLTALVIVAWPGSASAHAVLLESSPAPSSVLQQSPSGISLDFNEDIESALLSIRLFDADQSEVSIGDAGRDPADSSIARAAVPRLDDGVYVVVWRAVSGDGHPVSGAFPFQVGNTPDVNANELLTRVLRGLDTQSPLGTPIAVSRFLAYVALVALVGVTVFSMGAVGMTPRLVRAMKAAVVSFAAGAVGITLMQGPYAAGRGWAGIFDAGLLADVFPTRLGIASAVRLAMAIVWGVLVLTLHRRGAAWWKALFATTSIVSVVTFSISGHASAGSLPAVFVTVDAVHFTAVCVWVGAFLAAALMRTEEGVARLSRLATVAMPIAVVTGAAQSVHLAGGVTKVFDTRHGSYLFVKLALVVVCLAIGGRLRMRMKKGQPTVNRMLSVEAVLLVAILAVSALMVGTSPTATAAGSSTFSSTQIQSGVVADFSILPTRVGAAEVHVYLTPPGGALSPVEDVKMSFTLPSRGIPAVPVKLVEVGPNHWSGIMQFAYEGEWTMETRVKPDTRSTLLYTAVVPVAEGNGLAS